MSARKVALDRLMSPFVVACVDAFRDAYARTGMNLAQSMAMFVVAAGQRLWRMLANHKVL
jgi:hypothetical protein